jgi:RNA ligase
MMFAKLTPRNGRETSIDQRRREDTSMTTYLHDLFDLTMLDDMINDGYVTAREHPNLPLRILNYTNAASYGKVWNPVTRQCRGLIYNTTTMEVVARPYSKFFNYGETEAAHLKLDIPVIVTDKADGSLAVLYPVPGSHAIATRGSFTSDQAIHATQIWKDRYEPVFTPTPGLTYLFEVVYPENRIVLSYDIDDLILIGVVNIDSGLSYPPSAVQNWHGPVVEIFPVTTLAEALAMPPRENAEGVVVHFIGSNERLKIKQLDYIRYHKLIMGLNARAVWEHMMSGADITELIEPLPDEFHEWVRHVADDITNQVEAELAEINLEYYSIRVALPDRFTRRDFATLATSSKHKWALFLALDGRDIRSELLKRAKPEAFQIPTAVQHTEDTA